MSTLRSYFSSELIARHSFSSYPCKSIELFTDNNGPCIPKEQLLATDKDIIEWTNQEGVYASDPSVKCLLRLLYQELPKEEMHSWYENKVKFSKPVYEHVSKSFNLSPEFLEFYHQEQVPLAINLPSIANEYTTITMQCTNCTMSATVNLSHHAQTGTTQGFLIFFELATKQAIINTIRAAALDAAHPLLLPAILLHTWKEIFINDNFVARTKITNVKEITQDVFNPALAAMLQSRVHSAHKLLYEAHRIIHATMADFMLTASANFA